MEQNKEKIVFLKVSFEDCKEMCKTMGVKVRCCVVCYSEAFSNPVNPQVGVNDKLCTPLKGVMCYPP